MLLELVLTNEEGLVGNVMVEGSLGYNDQKMEFGIMKGRNKAISEIATLDFRRVKLDLFKDLLGGFPWVRTLERRVAQES